jgi:Flp pilus assembly protein TadB
MRMSPSPLLHRKHGPPVIVGALAHGGFSKPRQAECLRALEPVCDQLNALLHSVQVEQPSRTPAALGMRPADHMAGYRSFRVFFIAMTIGIVAICAAIAALVHFGVASLWVLAIALVQVIGTPIVLNLVRKDFQRKAREADST